MFFYATGLLMLGGLFVSVSKGLRKLVCRYLGSFLSPICLQWIDSFF